MSESRSHRIAKKKAAGVKGSTEVPLSRNRRLDALSANQKRATEVERSGDLAKLQNAARRLRDSGANQRVLQVPNHHIDLAAQAMRNVGISGTVKNMSGSKRRFIG